MEHINAIAWTKLMEKWMLMGVLYTASTFLSKVKYMDGFIFTLELSIGCPSPASCYQYQDQSVCASNKIRTQNWKFQLSKPWRKCRLKKRALLWGTLDCRLNLVKKSICFRVYICDQTKYGHKKSIFGAISRCRFRKTRVSYKFTFYTGKLNIVKELRRYSTNKGKVRQ